MRLPLRPLLPVIAVLTAGLLAGCAVNEKNVQMQDDFRSTDIHAHRFAGSDSAICEAARRALLSQGYLVSEASASLVRGRKHFQPQGGGHVQIEFHVVCAPNGKGSNSTTAFANAVRDRYSLKKSSTSASLGVGALGSLSVPFGSSDDSLVKVASETIAAKQFYEGFFALMERYAEPEAVDADEDAPEPDR